jgi:ribosomal protein S2
MVEYCLLLGKHILEITAMEPCSEILESFEINKRWLSGEITNEITSTYNI